MTSEPDSTPRRRPPTIDLTAKEVETAPGPSTSESAAAESTKAGKTHAGRNSSGGAIPYMIGALVGARRGGSHYCRDLVRRDGFR